MSKLFIAFCAGVLCTVLLSFSADGKAIKVPFKDIVINVTFNTGKLSQVFETVEKQTSFSFVYDENEINLSREIKLKQGQQTLYSVLKTVSEQANLRFTQKKNIILVISEHPPVASHVKMVVEEKPPVSGIVTDSAGTPLQGVTVALKGGKVAVQTDESGKFSINVPV